MNLWKGLKLFAVILVVAIVNIVVLSPGFIGVEIGGSPLSTALGITLLFASALVLGTACYTLLIRQPPLQPAKQLQTYEDYENGLRQFLRVRVLEAPIQLTLEQMERLVKKRDTLLHVLKQRFDPAELSYKKFASVTHEVEKLFFLNIRSMLNQLSVFDESEFERAMRPKAAPFSQRLIQEKTNVHRQYLSYVEAALGTNEEILLKLDKLLLEISRLDTLELHDVENMPCMQEIDALIKQTKYYRQ